MIGFSNIPRDDDFWGKCEIFSAFAQVRLSRMELKTISVHESVSIFKSIHNLIFHRFTSLDTHWRQNKTLSHRIRVL